MDSTTERVVRRLVTVELASRLVTRCWDVSVRLGGLAPNATQTSMNAPAVTLAVVPTRCVRILRGPTGVYVRQGTTKPPLATVQVCYLNRVATTTTYIFCHIWYYNIESNWYRNLMFSDIDECITNPCGQTCSNTPGSYSCSCNPGFRLVGTTQCEDFDECSAPVSPCDQICTNSIGSYRCSCNEGFLLNTTTRRTCYSKTRTGYY